jgi:hypothetical protein
MKQTEQLEPAKSIISRAGGVDAVAAITGRHRTRVYRWMYSTDRGGTGGEIPQKEARKILDHARKNGIELTADDFMPVRAPEVAA